MQLDYFIQKLEY